MNDLIKDENKMNVLINNSPESSPSLKITNQKKNWIPKFARKTLQSKLTKYVLSATIVSVAGILMSSLHLHIGYQAISLVFLFIIALLPLLKFEPGPIFLAAVMSAFIWNFFFIPPFYTLRIGKVEDVLMFFVYFIFASVLGLLNSRIRSQQIMIDQREKRTSALYNLTRALSSAKSLDDVSEFTVQQIKETFNAETVLIYCDNKNRLNTSAHLSSSFNIDAGEWNIAHWVFANKERAGRFTNTIPITPASYFPIKVKKNTFGVIGLVFPLEFSFTTDTDSFINAFISQISIAVEREHLKEQAKTNLVVLESEKLYKTLFDSISHELKTPITTIIGSVSSLKDEKILKNQSAFSRLTEEANIAAERLNRLVENLLDITRLESGNLKPKKEWGSITDLINSVLERIKIEAFDHIISFETNEDIGIFKFDFPLLEQALINIIHNSVEYTISGSKIEIFAKKGGENLIITITDNGIGFPDTAIPNLFKKFYRVPGTKAGGIGLGLSIAKGFIEAHGGTITAMNKLSGGAEFTISLPLNENNV